MKGCQGVSLYHGVRRVEDASSIYLRPKCGAFHCIRLHTPRSYLHRMRGRGETKSKVNNGQRDRNRFFWSSSSTQYCTIHIALGILRRRELGGIRALGYKRWNPLIYLFTIYRVGEPANSPAAERRSGVSNHNSQPDRGRLQRRIPCMLSNSYTAY